jgi:hypothetical protein
MGIHWDRDTTSGAVSEHSWGAALDFGTGAAQVEWLDSVNVPTGAVMTVAEHHAMCDWIVAHSAELEVQAIVSIGRSWKCNRVDNGAGGWIPYDSGYTGHAHIVTTLDGWENAAPIADRLTQPEEPTVPKSYIQLPPEGREGHPHFVVDGGSARVATGFDTGLERFRDIDDEAVERYDLMHESIIGRRP